jgi:hypothetical protein
LGQPATPAEDPLLASRQVNYGLALRTASLKLVGELPSLDEQKAVTDAASYAAQIDDYLADPRFATQLLFYFRDMMKMGGQLQVRQGQNNVMVNLDAAPLFAARLVTTGRPMTELFTATTNTCPTLDRATGVFTDGNCQQTGATVGVLTDPGAMAQMFTNMAFRRARWVQETFVCTKFPAEYTQTPKPMGSGQYISPWPFESITGGTDAMVAPINFHDTSAVVCANCHSTMNHIAPLFAYFDVAGQLQTAIQVRTPTPQMPASKLSDWLPANEGFAWRFGKPVKNLTELGAAMAADSDTAACHVARTWNWAMSKTDIVNDLAVVPTVVIDSLTKDFVANNQNMKALIKRVFTSDDFVKF